MTMPVIAQYADLIAAVAILITLIILIFELRQNAKQSAYANWQGVMGFVRAHREWSSNPETANIIARGKADFGALTDGEKQVFENWTMSGLTSFFIMLEHGSGAVAERTARQSALRQTKQLLSFPGTVECWHECQMAKRYPPQFVEVVDQILGEEGWPS